MVIENHHQLHSEMSLLVSVRNSCVSVRNRQRRLVPYLSQIGCDHGGILTCNSPFSTFIFVHRSRSVLLRDAPIFIHRPFEARVRLWFASYEHQLPKIPQPQIFSYVKLRQHFVQTGLQGTITTKQKFPTNGPLQAIPIGRCNMA